VRKSFTPARKPAPSVAVKNIAKYSAGLSNFSIYLVAAKAIRAAMPYIRTLKYLDNESEIKAEFRILVTSSP
jgi:quinolinate synthase